MAKPSMAMERLMATVSLVAANIPNLIWHILSSSIQLTTKEPILLETIITNNL